MKTSIVMLTCNKLPLTINCLESIWKNTSSPYELIMVDNGSTDGTLDYLKGLGDKIILIENPRNLGFSKGCNQGFQASSGEHILFLNNDTVVPAGWMEPMIQALYRDDDVAMVGPVTNYISGLQQIPVDYTDIRDMERFAQLHSRQNRGIVEEVRRVVGFCMLVKRSVLEDIGVFDERYGLGNYEDDDLCLRAIRSGYKLLIAREAFIHHIGHASMGQPASASLNQLLEENRTKSIHKWGFPIHTLMHTPAVRISACLVTCNNENSLENTLTSIREVAEEIIVVDCNSRDRTVEIAERLANRVIAARSAKNPELRAEIMYQLATESYLLWMEPGDTLDASEQRRIRGLKMSLFPEYDVVSFPLGKGHRYLTARHLRNVGPKDIEDAPATAFFRWDSISSKN